MSGAEEVLKVMSLEQKIAQLQCTMSIGNGVLPDTCPHGMGAAAVMPVGMCKEQLGDTIEVCGKEIGENVHGVAPIFHVEALTGASIAEATVFPSAIGLGATFDPQAVEEAAEIIHDQVRAVGFRQVLAPVLDVCRDQRWGRIGETYGEDPTLNSMIGTAYVKGVQGKDNDKIAATGKHFLGYGYSSGGLNMATCMATSSEIREVYAKPFQAAITEAGLLSVMNSYGTIDGEMIIGSEHILTDLLREEMEFDGIVVSDYASIEHLADHGLAKDIQEAGRQALLAGLDVECPFPVGYQMENILDALQKKEISEEVIDCAVLRILKVKEKLGLLEACSPARERLDSFYDRDVWEKNLDIARESIVLLKNDGILPLKKNVQKIAVIGPHADNKRLLFGCYTFAAGTDMMLGGSLADQAGMDMNALSEATMKVKTGVPYYEGSCVEKDNPDAIAAVDAAYPFTKTILTCIKERVPEAEIHYALGCEIAGTNKSGFEEAIETAKKANVVILTVGGKYGWGGSCTVGEGIDSEQIGMTGVQEELALKLAELGTPLVVVHMDARPFANPKVAEKANAILENWFPGTTGGEALADVLFGDYNPSGRLPVTAPKSTGQIPVYSGQYVGNSYYSVDCPTCSCRYVDADMEPLYYFGHGLSYSQFEYSNIKVKNTRVAPDETISVSCRVKNISKIAGDEVVQLYVSDIQASKLRPHHEFAGAARVHLDPDEEKEIAFTMRADQFAFVGKDGKWIVEEGDMKVMIGKSSKNLLLESQFYISETSKIRPAKRGFFAKTEIRDWWVKGEKHE